VDVYDWTGDKLEINDEVIWLDPEEDARDLRRVWTIYDIVNEELVKIADDASEAEVAPNELVKASNVLHVDIIVK
jgi:hypothetical protein